MRVPLSKIASTAPVRPSAPAEPAAAPAAASREVPLGPLASAPAAASAPPPLRLQHSLRRLERDATFGQGFLSTAGAGEASLQEVIDRVPDLFDATRRAQLDLALERLQHAMARGREAAVLSEVERQLGARATAELSRDPAEQRAGALVGALAATNVLGQRTRVATVANRVDGIRAKVLRETPAPKKKPKLRDRPAPDHLGTEGQGELEGKPLRPDGRISGRRFVGAYRAQEIARAEALGVTVDARADAFLDGAGANAGFDAKTGTIRVRADATALEWFHEMTHAEQYVALGPEAYNRQTRLEKELHVFRAIEAHSAEFNAYEYEAARNYIVRLAEAIGAPVPEEVR